MSPITFEAEATGGTITIPPQYAKQVESRVRVMLFPVSAPASKKSDRIPFYGFDTSNYTFNRDEANAR
ncbi:MAG: hypothetical protein LBK67_07675 [Coriobacteriales bacterium]|jgi:hypothetical protein|nr:hypothetical protein [Coriobacteriales bacterium]